MGQLARSGATLADIKTLAAIPSCSFEQWDAWVRRHFRYRGEVEEIVRTVGRMLDDLDETGYLEGDCDDIATFHAAVLLRAGFRPELVAIRISGDREFSHVFCRVQGFVFDPVVPIGTGYPDTVETLIEKV